MKKRGYITTTSKYHFILLSEKQKFTVYMLAAMIRKIAETQELPPEMAEAAMRDSTTRREFRKRIVPCIYEIMDGRQHIEIGKSELNYPISEKCVVVFEEPKPKPIITEIYEEA